MIPHCVSLEGFLCYGTRQEIDLSDLGLGMLSGPNGAGKSSVFDAITFALFGAHRGGEQGHADLVHTGLDAALVEFDFRLDGELWRVRRIVRRRKGKAATPDYRVQLFRWSQPASEAGNAPPGAWQPVPETDSHGGFKEWVRRHVGLTFETFTCSMLLRQGDAGRLLSSKPADRFEVLAGIVGLERYQRLEERAKAHCRRAEGESSTLQKQLGGLPPVSDDELRQAAATADAAAAAAEGAGRDVEALQLLLEQARRWSELQARLRDAETERRRHADLLRRGPQIERDWKRLAELRAALPLLGRLLQHRSALHESRRRATELTHERQLKQQALSQADQKLEDLRRSHGTAGQTAAAAEARERELGRRRAELEKSLAAAEPYEKHAAELARVRGQIEPLPPDPAAELDALSGSTTRSTRCGRRCPHWGGWRTTAPPRPPPRASCTPPAKAFSRTTPTPSGPTRHAPKPRSWPTRASRRSKPRATA